MKKTFSKVNPYLKNQITKSFAQTLVDFTDLNDMLTFLKDFFSEKELEMFSKRLAVSYWLKKGRSYSNITNNLKASSATISQVSSLMKSKGMEEALKKMDAEEWATLWSKKIKKFVGR
ncbi:hypothetical protein A2W13_01440 [Candidatus Woesebacteria bacterium RBG_16_36_11]|uniref:TrpR like protein, YerC/YecD n=3 Tax=Candidatus Woeseibacteriota TaxID=1752722 RepID=A0A1F7XB86_9BACT|nr:MAG: hypothetical protein A2Z67_03445 [Candidatus Woesebacteria bacterium RBG_13_36_22]OGM12290.1 MAG: hypothetical protein A2W13_01440 [Candidatus Woesebacteria bacterium RBG_16_36_11]OGM16681.1 MAG: hypothetical protein A2V55_01040 [Candidatus Woesebacteria bacterium RBG_19FT_COMBO_37_29]